MSLQNFEILNKIGEGSYSDVHRVRRKSDGMIYALKKVRFVSLNEKEKENALNEVRILASITHPNVIGYKEAFIDESSNSLCIIMELADGGDLLQRITQVKQKRSHFPESEVWDIFTQTLRGLKALHDLNILHRDLKCANVYLFKNGSIKIGDMNVSKVAKLGLVYTQTGTPYYASPEVWKDKPYDSKSDIWSLGCVIYEIAAQNPPFQALDMKGLFKKVVSGDYPSIPSRYSEDLKKIISFMLRVDSRKRPSCNDLLTNSLIVKNCENSEPLSNDNILLNTIKLPKQIGALVNSLPASNYSDKKISHKFPEPFRKPSKQRILSEPHIMKRYGAEEEKIDDERIDLERYKKEIEKPKGHAYHSPYKKETVAQKIQALKAQYDKLPPSLPPVRYANNRQLVKPSWWG